MSTKYRNSRDVPVEVIVARLKELSDAVAGGRESQQREFTMRIPAECDRDADLVMGEAARRLESMRQQLEQSQARVAELESLAERALEVAENELGLDFVMPHTETAMKELFAFGRAALNVDEAGEYESAWLLRKQAEAVERLKDFKYVAFGTNGMAIDVLDITKEAQRLRQQADELEQQDGRP